MNVRLKYTKPIMKGKSKMPKIPKKWMQNASTGGAEYVDRILKAGKYKIDVRKAWVDKASTGNECIVLSIDVLEGTSVSKIYDRLWFTELAAFKIHNFCKMAGFDDIIKTGGDLKADRCIGVRGIAEIVIEDATGDYPERNVISNYQSQDTPRKPAAGADSNKSISEDDDLPF